MAGLRSFRGRWRVLHLSWFAFFLSFVVWFDYAPFANTIARDLGLTPGQSKTLALCNVALTVPARIFIGMALDRWGPRRVYRAILVLAVIPNTAFALAGSFTMLVISRLALSIVGAGFVVGIRLVAEWFPPREVGTAEGIYGGWGNFGSAVAAFALPVVAGVAGGPDGWRWAIGSVGIVAAAFGVVFGRHVTDTPAGVAYARPRRHGALEVTSRAGVWGLTALSVPLHLVLVVIVARVWSQHVVSDLVAWSLIVVIGAMAVGQLVAVWRVNAVARRDQYEPDDRYPVRSVAALCIAYFATFGSELAIVSLLPSFFADTWGLGPAAAGAAASGFAFMNLAARPAGGVLSDRMGSRRRTLTVLLAGLIGGYALLATVGPRWPWLVAVGACMVCSAFVQAGEGAVFAVVPLVKKRVSGQIAGLVGAYGNVGAITFLTIGLFVSTRALFAVIAVAAVVATVASRLMVEPTDGFSQHLVVDTPLAPRADAPALDETSTTAGAAA